MRTTVKSIASFAMLLCFCFNALSQQVAKTIPNATSPDGRIGFLEFRPKDYGTQKHPLIIFLHGIGERGNGTTQINSVANNGVPRYCAQGATMRFTVAGQTSTFVVLSPQLSASYGYWPSFYVQEMVKYAKANLQIDPDRIYITGLSLGGGGVWGSITDAYNPGFDAGIAAAAPVCGTQQMDDGMFCSTIGANNLPVWAFHAMDDGVVGVGATQHAEIVAKNCGISPAMKFTYYQTGGHSGAWLNAYDTGRVTKTVMVNGVATSYTANPNLYEWFLSNKRSTGTGTPAYTAPTASAGLAQTITLPLSTVTLTGSGAGTNGATITGYSWAKTSGPAGGIIVSVGSTVTLITGLLQGTYVFTLTVTDNHGLTSSSAVSVTVNALASIAPIAPVNQPPVSVAGADAAITLPTNSIALNGTASSDADGTIVEYYWAQSSGPSTATIANNFSASTTAGNLVQGVYKFVLQTKDNSGAMAYSMKTVTVNAAPVTTGVNQKPVSAAGADATVTLPTNSISLNGSSSYDPDGTIVEFYWSQSSGPSAAAIGNNFSVSTTAGNLVQGTYIFVLQAKDNAGAMGYSMKTVTVKAATATAGNQSPVSNAGADATITLPTSSVSLNGSASYDPDGTIVEYYWSQSSGPSSTNIANNFAVSTTASNLVKGEYLFVLQAKDNKGGMGYSLKKVTVNSAGTASAAAVSVTGAQPIGYIKMSTGPYQACDDASSTGRMAIYSPGISNGGIVYTDAAMTSVYNGGWNWFSFTPVLGGATTYAFAVFPNGSIALLRNCLTGTNLRTVNGGTTAEEDIAALSRMKDSAAASLVTVSLAKLSLYPNPVHTSATIELTSTDNGLKVISLFDANGALKAKYTWQTTTGRNLYSLKDVTGLANGFYVLDITDARGKRIAVQKFLKM